MNDLSSTTLKNTYFILRHGESEANVAHLITSNPAQCIAKYGLTKQGKEQVTASVQQAKSEGWLDNETIIYNSDFKRAAETAEIAREVLGAGKTHPTQALRERSFGAYDGKPADAYIAIWMLDRNEQIDHMQKNVEGPHEMSDRLLALIKELEGRCEGKRILLVSHGDPLQVLQAAFAGLSPSQSSSLSYISQGELRELKLTAAS